MISNANATARRRRAWLVVAAVATAVVIATPGASTALQDEDDRRETTRATIEKWVEVKSKIEKERHAWAIDRDLLVDRADVLSLEIEEEKKVVAKLESDIARLDKENEAYKADSAALGQGIAVLEARIVELENRTREIVKRLPEPLKDRVDLLIQRIPKDSAKTELKLFDRYQTVIGILTAANKFNGEIFKVPERRELSNGETAEVTTMYLGLSKAYYATNDGKHAGIGTPTGEGWVFEHADHASAEISEAIKVLNKEADPSFVRIPVKVD